MTTQAMSSDAPASLRLIAEALSLAERLGARRISVRDIRVSDRTLVVEIDVDAVDPIAVRAEIANTMGALSGLGIPELFPVLGIQSFGVRALRSATDEELLWIVSSLEAAGFIAAGQPIEWLSRSIVQENTPVYRRAQADRLIGQIETALRDVIDHHGTRHVGSAYVTELWPDAVAEMTRQARAEGEDPGEPRVLLDFAYLPQLRDAVLARALWFDDGCVPDSRRFSDEITKLNRVRRKVAHHRAISDADVRVCRSAAESIIEPIGHAHASSVEDFAIDRWEDEAQRIVRQAQAVVQSPTIPERGTMAEEERRDTAVGALRTQRAGIAAAIERFRQLVVPPARRQLHNTAVEALTRWQDALGDLIKVGERPGLDLAKAERAARQYEDALLEVRHLSQRIRE